MQLFRLVNQDENPTAAGDRLTTCSKGRRAKLGDGMYFASSRDCAMAFNDSNHGRNYTHLLICELPGINESDFVSKDDPQLVRSRLTNESQRARNARFCEEQNKKGILAQETGWTEFYLLEEHVGDGILITQSEQLNTRAAVPEAISPRV